MINFTDCIIKEFITKENDGIALPINEIKFVSDVSKEILKIDPEVANTSDFKSNWKNDLSGYTALFSNNTATILIDNNDISKNILWVETLVHELTHVKDYCDYLETLNCENLQEMKKDRPFYFWTEFHARYKGFEYMLPYVLKFPEKCKEQYIRDTEIRLNKFIKIKNQHYNNDKKIYDTMHIIGEVLAYENSSVFIDETYDLKIIETFDWFEDTKLFLKKHTKNITRSEMLLLSMNMRKVFEENEV